ncbi:PREDICTED: chymotrypsin-2-like [Vollenhovia emeryi]|uniref:chymotrypsin-2-like n=1 Tax=Vollenhovia emeryi TaxID=411798 RepID=UPI0005F4C8BC|nr:PREDICTED: chymotrypsin-2-like [Vollenhovia emeryi]
MLSSVLFLLGVASISQSSVLQRFDPRIINGEDVELGEIPYQVSLQLSTSSFHFCGGSIVNPNFVVTAAHCVEGKVPMDIKIIVGTVNLDRPRVIHAAKEIIVHKEYDSYNSWINDIALIRVYTSFVPSNDVGFVPLPEQDETVQEGAVARVSGFGRLSQDGPGSKILQKATIYIAKQSYCKKMYEKLIYNIYNTHICANDPNVSRGSCNGDSGGPLIVNGKLVGLVSWAKACSLTDYPTVYTRVPSYINWIKENAV